MSDPIITNPPVMTVNTKPWGAEFVIELAGYLVKVIVVNEGEMTSLQYHKEKEEVQYVLDTGGGFVKGVGDGALLIEGVVQPMWTAIPIADHVIHRTIGPEVHLEISTNHPDDVVRIADAYGGKR